MRSEAVFWGDPGLPLFLFLPLSASRLTPPPPRPPDQNQKQKNSYAKTQEYRPHSDYFTHPLKDENGGNRMATVLMYLSTPDKGGETIFPRVKAPQSQLDDPSFSECAQKGLAVKARKGDAVLFWSIRPDGRFDPGSHHGGCPVEEGIKFAATKWSVISFLVHRRRQNDDKRRQTALIKPPNPNQNNQNNNQTKPKQDPRRPLCRGLREEDRRQAPPPRPRP